MSAVVSPVARRAPNGDERGCAAAVAAACLPYLARLQAALEDRQPSEAWALVNGRHSLRPADSSTVLGRPGVMSALRAAAAQIDAASLMARCRELGVGVTYAGAEDYPDLFVGDLAPPPVLFWKGALDALTASWSRRVAIVGTRRATAAGRSLARQLGYELSAAGVSVVSGLARGIDGAAHGGALAASASPAGVATGFGVGRPIGVVANGLDAAYPRQHAELWDRVATEGLLLSEAPPGAPPIAMLFPRRNRLIAAAAEVLVVVESAAAGGSMLTVNEANKRGLTVMAVPGSPNNPVAAGTNRLLRDGSSIVVESGDVLAELSLNHRRVSGITPAIRQPSRHRSIFRVCHGGAATLEQIVLAIGGDIGEVASALVELVADGWLIQHDGWYEVNGDRR